MPPSYHQMGVQRISELQRQPCTINVGRNANGSTVRGRRYGLHYPTATVEDSCTFLVWLPEAQREMLMLLVLSFAAKVPHRAMF